MADTGEDWELCKENIQPLKQGRAMSSLQAALQGKDTVQQRRKDFEEELRTYSGDDALDVWHRYIVWLEQHFPKGGHEVNMNQLLEKCIALFLPETKYANDTRYVGVWLRYVDGSPDPEPVFRTMYDREVGTALASLYAAWATHREAVGDSKGASKVLRKGLSRGASPRETLEAQLRHLEARVSRQVAQQMREGGIQQQTSAAEESRGALAPLRQVGSRGQVSVERASQRAQVQGGVGGQAPVLSANRAPRVLATVSSENDEEVFARPAEPAPFVAAAERSKENTSKPGKWTSAKVKQVTQNVGARFTIPQDEAQSEPVPRTPEWVPGSSKALSVQHGSSGDQQVPASRFILVQNPKERPMYDKLRVYGGTRELQFEEIRWAKMLAREREQVLERPFNAKGRAMDYGTESVLLHLVATERLEREAAKEEEMRSMRLQMEQMRRELDEMRQLLAQNRNGPTRQQQAMKEHINLLEQSILVTDQSLRAAALPAAMKPNVGGVAAACQNASQRSSPSSGNNTATDVSCMVRGLWNGTLIQSGLEDKILCLEKTVQGMILVGFAGSAEGQTPHPATVGAAFEVLSEPTQPQPPSVPCCPADPVIAPEPDQADENGPPPGLSQLRARSASGSRHQRIPFAELEPTEEGQEAEEEEEEAGGMDGIQPFPDEDNFTYAPTKSFVKKVTSTPFDGRLPRVGEDFTVGGLTGMVQEVALDPEARREPSQAAIKGRLSVPLAVAGDLSTILEGSKECSSKSGSSSSGSSCSSGLSSASVAALSAHSRLPALQEEASLPRWQQRALIKIGKISFASYDCNLPRKSRQQSPPAADDQHDDLDPFDRQVTDAILCSLALPLDQHPGFFACNTNRPLLKLDHTTALGQPRREFHVLQLLATGAYAKVYLAEPVDPETTFMDTDGSFEHPTQRKVVLKVLGDSNLWEFYVCSDLRERLAERPSPSVLDSVVATEAAYVYKNGAILVMPFGQYGTLLDLVRRYKEQRSQGGQGIPESLALYFALELLLIVSTVHKCSIIHGDFKPDNVLICDLQVFFLLLASKKRSAKILCSGRGNRHRGHKNRYCGHGNRSRVCGSRYCGRGSQYRTDWYGVAACMHVMLFGEYMEVVKGPDGTWAARQKFKRQELSEHEMLLDPILAQMYWQRDLWESLFFTLLNIPSCAEPPDVSPFVAKIKELLGNHSRAQDLLVHAHKASCL
ncbi:unnamed protein product [Ixodes hexagonus]